MEHDIINPPVVSIQVHPDPTTKNQYGLSFMYDELEGDVVKVGSLAYITKLYYELNGDDWQPIPYKDACVELGKITNNLIGA